VTEGQASAFGVALLDAPRWFAEAYMLRLPAAVFASANLALHRGTARKFQKFNSKCNTS
jgi:hypothetical protein